MRTVHNNFVESSPFSELYNLWFRLVSCSQTAFFCLHLGGKKGSGLVSMGYTFLTFQPLWGVLMNSNTFRLPLGSINRCLWSRMFANSSIDPQIFNLWVWQLMKGVGFIYTPHNSGQLEKVDTLGPGHGLGRGLGHTPF